MMRPGESVEVSETRLLLPSRKHVIRWRLESMSTSDAPHVPGRASPARDDTDVFAARAFPADPGVGVDDRTNHSATWAAARTPATSHMGPDDLVLRRHADGCDDRPEVVGKASRAGGQVGRSPGLVEEVPKVSDPGVRHGYAQREPRVRAARPSLLPGCFRRGASGF